MNYPITIKKVRASSFLVVELEGVTNTTLRRYQPRAWEWAERVSPADSPGSTISFRPVVDSNLIESLEEKIHEYLQKPKIDKRAAVFESYKEGVG